MCIASFDVYNIETALPVIDLEAIENHLKAAKEEERRVRTFLICCVFLIKYFCIKPSSYSFKQNFVYCFSSLERNCHCYSSYF